MKCIFTIICGYFVVFANAQRCATPDYTKQNNVFSTPAILSSPGSAVTGERDTLKNEVIVIPVVVHVLYHNSTQNISDAQVLSQITVLNNDYRRLNADTNNTPDIFKSIAADAKIVFCLAKVNPYGRYTSGIVHKYTGESLFLSDDGMKFSSKGGDDAWDSKKYLNIWVCNLFGRTLGYSVLPGSPPERDGVVIQYDVFGTTGNVTYPYNKGRTVTHEIGHWLGLRHLWGDAVCGNDGIDDTPPQQTNSTGCPVFPHLSNCSVNQYGDMFMNFMDFTDDACMNMFTQGQKSEMRSLFATGGFRNSFLNSNVCDASLAQGGPPAGDTTQNVNIGNAEISVYPNPFADQVTISCKNETDIATTIKTMRIYDATGKLFITQKLQSAKTIINLRNLPNGFYILKVEGGNKINAFKLLKQSL